MNGARTFAEKLSPVSTVHSDRDTVDRTCNLRLRLSREDKRQHGSSRWWCGARHRKCNNTMCVIECRNVSCQDFEADEPVDALPGTHAESLAYGFHRKDLVLQDGVTDLERIDRGIAKRFRLRS
jgi:hypothetical protein